MPSKKAWINKWIGLNGGGMRFYRLVSQLFDYNETLYYLADTVKTHLFTFIQLKTAAPYPIKSLRLQDMPWNKAFQMCYLDHEVALLQKIKKTHQFFFSSDYPSFNLQSSDHWYGFRICYRPKIDSIQPPDLYTLPIREAKDSAQYPLWHYADNMARQIANWQGERLKNQIKWVMNDPVMLLMDELREWFYHDLSQEGCHDHSLQLIQKRQSYLKNLVHLIPDFGLDRLHLLKLEQQLNEAVMLVSQCMANKELPEFLASFIVKAKNLEMVLGTFLHFLLNNEEVEDNYSAQFTEALHQDIVSPINKAYLAAKRTSIQENLGLKGINQFYDYVNPEAANFLKIHPHLKYKVLDDVKFASFLKPEDKIIYLKTLAGLDSLIAIRKVFENFKSTQSGLGNYLFAKHFLEATQMLGDNYVDLIDQTEKQMKILIQLADAGFEALLSSSDKEKKSLYFFERNLKALDMLFSKETTTEKQFQMQCLGARESIKQYQETMKNLVERFYAGQAQQELDANMQQLVKRMQQINCLIPAQINNQFCALPPLIQPSSVEAESFTLSPCLANDYSTLTNEHQGRWDSRVYYHPLTKQPIFTYRFYQNQVEVGSAEFYAQPQLCFSADGQQHNLVKQTGLVNLSSLTAENDSNLCVVLPLTKWNEIMLVSSHAAGHGFIRAASQVCADWLKLRGIKTSTADYLKKAIYYQGIFGFNLFKHYQTPYVDPENTRFLSSLFYAAIETGELLMIDTTLTFIQKMIYRFMPLRDEEDQSHFSFKKLAALSRFGVFACQTATHGLAQTASALFSGVVTQTVVEKGGLYMLKKTYGQN